MKRRRSVPTLSPAGCGLPAHTTIQVDDTLLSDLARQRLRENGYCVVKNVIAPEYCRLLINAWWAYLESLGTGISRDDPSTFYDARRKRLKRSALPHSQHGIQQYPLVSHAWWVWWVRAHPNVCRVFSKLWHCSEDELISSFDRICFVPRQAVPEQKSWWHLDQTAHRTIGKLTCYQGFITLNPIDGRYDTALMVLNASHKLHADFLNPILKRDKKTYPGAKNWLKLDAEQFDWYTKHENVHEVRVAAPAGSLVLWDSRTVHQSGRMALPAETERHDRHVVYVCQTHIDRCTPSTLQKRRKYAAEGRSTAHWPHHVKVFPKGPPFRAPNYSYPGYDLDAQLAALRECDLLDKERVQSLIGGNRSK